MSEWVRWPVELSWTAKEERNAEVPNILNIPWFFWPCVSPMAFPLIHKSFIPSERGDQHISTLPPTGESSDIQACFEGYSLKFTNIHQWSVFRYTNLLWRIFTKNLSPLEIHGPSHDVRDQTEKGSNEVNKFLLCGFVSKEGQGKNSFLDPQ